MTEDFDIPRNVLNNMVELMESGNLSKEDVIEHLINNGFLPVEVTDIGKLPISIGHSEKIRTNSEPLRIRKPERKFREELTRERLRELSTTQRIPFDEMKSVDISDPDFQFERIDPKAIRTEINRNVEDLRKSSEKLEESDKKITILTTTEKNDVNTTTFLKVDTEEMEKIEAVMTMIRMFENGQIDEDELLVMMSRMGEGIIGDFNPITEFTMFGEEGDMPVENSYFKMKGPMQTSQEKPPVEEEPIVFRDDDVLEPVKDPLEPPMSGPFTSFGSLGAGEEEGVDLIGQNVPQIDDGGQSIKTFTSFGNNFNPHHHNAGSKGRFVGNILSPSGVAKPQTLYYDDFTEQSVNINQDTFPTFHSFHLGHGEEVPPPPTHQYQDPGHTPHQTFSITPALTYSRPREPFGPPASLLISSLSPEYRQISPAEIQHQLHESQPVRYVKTLPEYPPYGPYSEGYPSYSEQPPPPSYLNHQHLPTPEYISSEIVRKHKPEYSSPLYLHHGPGGYDQDHRQPVYQPPGQYQEWNEYGSRQSKELIADLPDHTTRRSFSYEDLPLPPLTGYREIDQTIEDIHKAFVDGDSMGPQGAPS